MGSNMAEQHPVGFQWVIEAKERGAKVIHVDPRFTRTSAMADRYVPIRPGTDIAFLGGIVNYIFEHDAWFKDYVQHYTNGPVVINRSLQDTEDASGYFSGWNPEHSAYAIDTWGYDKAGGTATAGKSEQQADVSGEQAHGAHGMKLQGGQPPEIDETMQDERCVIQLVRRHFERYTPELVAEICGCSPEDFLAVAAALCENSGRERTSAIVYAVGWTQHTVGVQNIRAASIVQLLLGNIGRPGGGILALRGHANIQGSTDIPTLYNILPGYIPMPHPQSHPSLDKFVELNGPDTGAWGNLRPYIVSLLKAWWGDAATEENEFCFHHLPRINGDHSHYSMMLKMLDGGVQGMFVRGPEPDGRLGQLQADAPRAGQARLAGRPRLPAHRVSGCSGRTRPSTNRARCGPRTSRPRCSSCPLPPTPRRTATSPTPSGCSSGITRRASRRESAARSCTGSTTSAGGSARSWPAPRTPRTGRSSS